MREWLPSLAFFVAGFVLTGIITSINTPGPILATCDLGAVQLGDKVVVNGHLQVVTRRHLYTDHSIQLETDNPTNN